jgi:hypothetical protein
MKKLLFIGVMLLALTMAFSLERNQYIPKEGFIPNEGTAIKVAEAVWLPIYGDRIYKSKPFKAVLRDSAIWIVEGTLKENQKGGYPYIEIQKSDGKILKVTHSK